MCYSLPRKGRLEGSGGAHWDWEGVSRTRVPFLSPAFFIGFAGGEAERPNMHALGATGHSCCSPERLERPSVSFTRKGRLAGGRCFEGHAVEHARTSWYERHERHERHERYQEAGYGGGATSVAPRHRACSADEGRGTADALRHCGQCEIQDGSVVGYGCYMMYPAWTGEARPRFWALEPHYDVMEICEDSWEDQRKSAGHTCVKMHSLYTNHSLHGHHHAEIRLSLCGDQRSSAGHTSLNLRFEHSHTFENLSEDRRKSAGHTYVSGHQLSPVMYNATGCSALYDGDVRVTFRTTLYAYGSYTLSTTGGPPSFTSCLRYATTGGGAQCKNHLVVRSAVASFTLHTAIRDGSAHSKSHLAKSCVTFIEGRAHGKSSTAKNRVTFSVTLPTTVLQRHTPTSIHLREAMSGCWRMPLEGSCRMHN